MFVGVYGVVQLSEYNLRFFVLEVLVKGNDMVVVWCWLIFEEMLSWELMVDWFQDFDGVMLKLIIE